MNLIFTLCLTASASTPSAAVNNISGPIWDGNQGPLLSGEVYHALGDLSVPAGMVLTIEPGAIVKFDQSVDLLVDGRLDVNVADQSTVYFTSLFDDSIGGDSNGDGGATSPARGDWNGIIVQGTSEASTVRGAEVRYAGGGSFHALTAKLASASGHAFDDVHVLESSTAGIDLQGLENVAVTDCVVEHCTGAAIVGVDPDAMALMWNNDASDCAEIILQMPAINGDLNQSAELRPENLLHSVLPGPFRVADGVRMTLREGVIVKCLDRADPFQIDGELFCHGTASDPVIFTSLYDDAAGGDHNQDGNSTDARTR